MTKTLNLLAILALVMFILTLLPNEAKPIKSELPLPENELEKKRAYSLMENGYWEAEGKSDLEFYRGDLK